MRKSLNDNPAIAIGVIGLMGLIVAFMLLHAVSSRSSGASSATTSTTAGAPTDATASATTATPAASSAAPATGAPATATPAASSSAATVGAFEAGPGLPKAVVDAYDSGKVVAIVVLKRNGIDDRDVAKATAPLRNAANVAFFQTWASKVARYSRVTEGVDLNRVPAVVVMRPKSLTKGATPQASVGYGFRSLQSVGQALRDASYKGPENLPSFPR
jgi:hypothetical protein